MQKGHTAVRSARILEYLRASGYGETFRGKWMVRCCHALHGLQYMKLKAEVFPGCGAACLFTGFLQLLREMRALSPEMPVHTTDCRPARFEA